MPQTPADPSSSSHKADPDATAIYPSIIKGEFGESAVADFDMIGGRRGPFPRPRTITR